MAGTGVRRERWTSMMDKQTGGLGLIVGAIVFVTAAIFIFTGGDLGGKKTVEGDQDLPPVATADR